MDELGEIFETTGVAKFTPEQLISYEDSLKAYRDMKNALDTAWEDGNVVGKEEGRAEGRVEGIVDVAKNAIEAGFNNDAIKIITKLTDEQINEIRGRIQ